MVGKPNKIAIINRSFWPVYPVIGEALLRFAEGAADKAYSVHVILQDHIGIRAKLQESQRGNGVLFYPVKALTTSASGVISRVLDAVFFMFWVLASLLWIRPSRVYVSTDPPVVVPFIVMVYCRVFRAEYIYHLQDIHPEAANVVIPVNKYMYKLLLWLDAASMRYASCLITITDEMASEIRSRSGTSAPIHVLDNPAVSFENVDTSRTKKNGFSFCGNAGRLQRIPLLLEAIETYYRDGGQLEFVFAGGGIYANDLRAFAERFQGFKYLGTVSSVEAAQINADFMWALLPIEDEVTRYAFPSKSSSYVFSGANILAICSNWTSVAQWVKSNNLGLVAKPELKAIVDAFISIENNPSYGVGNQVQRDSLKESLRFNVFIDALDKIVLR